VVGLVSTLFVVSMLAIVRILNLGEESNLKVLNIGCTIVSIVEKKVIKLETVDKRDILMEEETEDPDIEDQDQDHPAMIDIVEEETTIEVAEIEAMKIKEGEEEIEEEEIDIHHTVEVEAMIAERMEEEIKETTEKKMSAEEEIQDLIQDMNKIEDQEIIDTTVRKESMDHKNL
jgi:hypothetical protein